MRKRIEGRVFDADQPLQALTGANLYDCDFTGAEYALKNARDITLENCSFSSPCSLHQTENFRLEDSRLAQTAAVSLHHCQNGKIIDSDIRGPQALRSCSSITLHDCSIFSHEFGCNCREITMKDCNVHADSIFRDGQNIRMDNVSLRGSDALQNTDSIQVYNSFLHSSHGLQNSKNITIVDSVLKGDYLGWNCENITLIGCKILGMQPLCHCRSLKLVDCVMEGCALAFEYSEVRASLSGHLNSVKNPRSGKITADSLGQVVMDDDTLNSTVKIYVRA